MRIAVSAESDQGLDSLVCEHFGHSPYFVLVDVQDGQMLGTRGVPNPFYSGHLPGQVPDFIHSQDVDVMVSGGMGAGAKSFFGQYGIVVATGATGTVLDAVTRYLNGELSNDASCAGGHHC